MIKQNIASNSINFGFKIKKCENKYKINIPMPAKKWIPRDVINKTDFNNELLLQIAHIKNIIAHVLLNVLNIKSNQIRSTRIIKKTIKSK